MQLIISCPVINTFASKFTINNNKTLHFHRKKKKKQYIHLDKKRRAMTRDVSKNRVQHFDVLVFWDFRIQIFKTHINKNRV